MFLFFVCFFISFFMFSFLILSAYFLSSYFCAFVNFFIDVVFCISIYNSLVIIIILIIQFSFYILAFHLIFIFLFYFFLFKCNSFCGTLRVILYPTMQCFFQPSMCAMIFKGIICTNFHALFAFLFPI